MDPIEEGRRNWLSRDSGPVHQVTAATVLTRGQQIATQRVARVLAGHDLTFAQLEVLVRLAEHPAPLGMGELGTAVRLHPTTAARTVARLERAGHVERIDDDTDRRVTRVRISDRGMTTARAALHGLRAIGFGLEGWTPRQARRFTTLADPIIES